MGVHQRIDRVARRRIVHHLPAVMNFPSIADILHFEGLNGPDGVKRKSPGTDEPWHFIDPTNPDDTALIDMITEHIDNLAQALAADNMERAAFEAAWLAHAITDGLTPAHHYPLEEKLSELRGEDLSTRNSIARKLLASGRTPRQIISNNWQLWGNKGGMTTHFGFELGVATVISGTKITSAPLASELLARLHREGFTSYYLSLVQEVFALNLYDEFHKKGWTPHLARSTKHRLLPIIEEAVTAGWYMAIQKATDHS